MMVIVITSPDAVAPGGIPGMVRARTDNFTRNAIANYALTARYSTDQL